MIVKTFGPEGGAPPAPGFRGRPRSRLELAYRGANASKYRHTVNGLGGTADAHYAHGMDYWRLRELAREFDRNDPNVGQIVDRGLDNILGSGLVVDPQTSDPQVNAALRDLWTSWADDPEACDYSGRFTFDELERLALRHEWIDGDCFLIFDDATGAIRFEEGDRVTSYDKASDDVVHGVVLDESGRPRSYLFRKLRPGERKVNTIAVSRGDLVEIPSQYVRHVYSPKRATQTRGITAFAPVFDHVFLASDIEHARLVKLQVASCIAGFITSDYPGAFNFGGSSDETSGYDGDTTLDFGEFTPGMIGKLRGGQKFEGFAPAVANADESEFLEQQLRRIGLAIGLPLEIGLLTSKNQSFSALRGVVEQYKITARVIQRRHAFRVRSRVYRWKVAQWAEAGLVPRLPDIDRHNVLTPTWAYINPVEDAQADAVRIERNLASPRQVWAERGRDYDQGIREIAADKAALALALHEQAKALEAAGVEGVTWRDLMAIGAPGQAPAAAAAPSASESEDAEDSAENPEPDEVGK